MFSKLGASNDPSGNFFAANLGENICSGSNITSINAGLSLLNSCCIVSDLHWSIVVTRCDVIFRAFPNLTKSGRLTPLLGSIPKMLSEKYAR